MYLTGGPQRGRGCQLLWPQLRSEELEFYLFCLWEVSLYIDFCVWEVSMCVRFCLIIREFKLKTHWPLPQSLQPSVTTQGASFELNTRPRGVETAALTAQSVPGELPACLSLCSLEVYATKFAPPCSRIISYWGCISYFVRLPWQNSEQKPLKEGKVYSGSWFEDTNRSWQERNGGQGVRQLVTLYLLSESREGRILRRIPIYSYRMMLSTVGMGFFPPCLNISGESLTLTPTSMYIF